MNLDVKRFEGAEINQGVCVLTSSRNGRHDASARSLTRLFQQCTVSLTLLATGLANGQGQTATFAQQEAKPPSATKADPRKPSANPVEKKLTSTKELPPPSKVTQDFYKAYSTGNLELADLLFRQGADVNCLNCGPFSPVGYALTSGLTDTASRLRWILSRGGDPNLPFMTDTASDEGRKSSWLFATEMWLSYRYSHIKNRSEVFGALMSVGVDVIAQDGLGRTALHHFAQHGMAIIPSEVERKSHQLDWERAVDEILRRGGNINARDRAGSTPLMFAYESRGYSSPDTRCGIPFVQQMQRRGADVKLARGDGKTLRDLVMDKALAGEKACNVLLTYLESNAQAGANEQPLAQDPGPRTGGQAQKESQAASTLTGDWVGVLKLRVPAAMTVGVKGRISDRGEVLLQPEGGGESTGTLTSDFGDSFAATLKTRALPGKTFPDGSTETPEFSVSGELRQGVLRGTYQATYDAGEFYLCKKGDVIAAECKLPPGTGLVNALGGLLGVMRAVGSGAGKK